MLATAIILCVPVSAHLDVEPGHTVAQTSTVYVLPDSSSESVGSVWDADVSVFWREGNYYYIEYAVSSGSYGGYKRGYIHKDNISVSWAPNITYPYWQTTCGSGTYDVWNRTSTSSYRIGSIWQNHTVTVVAEEGSWYYIEYPLSSGGYKRGYIQKQYLAARPQLDEIDPDKTYYIKNVGSGKYLEVYNAGTSNNTNVGQWSFHGLPHQQFKLEYSNGLYTIRPVHAPNTSVAVLNGTNSNGANIGIVSGISSSSSWLIAEVYDGEYRIMSSSSEKTKVMAVENAGTSNGANVLQWYYNCDSTDYWAFEEVFEEGIDYIHISNGCDSSQIHVNLSNVGTRRNDILASMQAWSQFPSVMSITENSLSTSYIYHENYTENPGTLGYYQSQMYDDISGRATRFQIKLHSQRIQNYLNADPWIDSGGFTNGKKLTEAEKTIVFRSIVSHELGHALGLGNNPTGAPSIMKYAYHDNDGYYPEKADIAGAMLYNYTAN